MKKVDAIIQARMTSTRLPGKVLMAVNGKTIFSYLIERLRHCKNVHRIILATTTNKEDDSLVAAAHQEGLPVYRGSEHDVLDRYYQAAKLFHVENIMRITADCPLLDPNICDQAIKLFDEQSHDYVKLDPRFAEGLDCEVISFSALEKSWQLANKKSEREHVTLYVRGNTADFSIGILDNEDDDSKYRFTVDSPEDFRVVSEIIQGLQRAGVQGFSAASTKQYLQDHPEVFAWNSHIIRNEGLKKSLQEDVV